MSFFTDPLTSLPCNTLLPGALRNKGTSTLNIPWILQIAILSESLTLFNIAICKVKDRSKTSHVHNNLFIYHIYMCAYREQKFARFLKVFTFSVRILPHQFKALLQPRNKVTSLWVYTLVYKYILNESDRVGGKTTTTSGWNHFTSPSSTRPCQNTHKTASCSATSYFLQVKRTLVLLIVDIYNV